VTDFLAGAEVIEQVPGFIFFAEFRFAGIQPPDLDTFFVIIIAHLAPDELFGGGIGGVIKIGNNRAGRFVIKEGTGCQTAFAVAYKQAVFLHGLKVFAVFV